MKWNNLGEHQKRKVLLWTGTIFLIAVLYLGVTCHFLYANKKEADAQWGERLDYSAELTDGEADLSKDAVRVSVSSYLEGIQNIEIRESRCSAVFQVCFAWKDGAELDGEKLTDMSEQITVYNGKIESLEVMDNRVNEKGIRIQKMRLSAVISNVFETTRFPLSSYQIRYYLMPKATIEKMIWIPDRENCRVNGSMKIAGFELKRSDANVFYYRTAEKIQYDGQTALDEENVYSEFLMSMEFNRSSWGVYIKCIIALIGTSVWAFLMLLSCTHHRVDSLGMIPAVLFGTVSNILVGANLIPDAMDTGLLEFINIWGIYTIIIISVVIMQMNQLRKNPENEEFTVYFGKWMIAVIFITTVIGHILLPVTAYSF